MSTSCLTHLPKDQNRSGSEMLCYLFNFYPAGVGIYILAHYSLKNVLFEQRKVKLWNKQHFVENKTEIIQHILKML